MSIADGTYALAGLVPVPEEVLRDRFNDALRRVEKTGVDPNSLAKPVKYSACVRV